MLKMKYSGVKWLGNIPDEWKVVRVDYYKDLKSNYPIGDGDHGTVTPEDYINEGIPYIRVQNLSWGNHIITDNIVYISETINKKNKKSILKPGDIVIAKTGATIGKIGIIPEEMPEANTTSSVGKVSVDNKYSNKYVFYSLLSDSSYQQMWDKANMKSAQPGFNIEDLVKFKICFPSIKEQYLIANFLDKKVGTINSIICDLDNQIEILGKYKKQLISEAVIKGLNKKVLMKDSGVEWIGSIPKHWNIKLIKNICSLKGRIGWEGLTKDEYISEGPTLITGINFDNGIINWDSCEHVSGWRYNQDKSIQIKNKDLLITKDGTVGKVAIVKDCPEKVTLNSGVLLLRPLNNEYIEKYLYYVLLSNEFWHWFEIENIGNTTIIHLYQNRFAKFKLALPPIDEQKEIANYLDKKCSEIDEILNSKMKQKEQMEQYKKSVIYEYVTGKKRVEGAEELYG